MLTEGWGPETVVIERISKYTMYLLLDYECEYKYRR